MVGTLAFINEIGPVQWLIILVFMLLIFGKRLPEVGKSLGKGIVEFKKGLKGVDDEVEQRSNPGYQQNYNQQQMQGAGGPQYQQQLPQGGVQTVPPMQQMPQQQPMQQQGYQQPVQYGQPGTVSRADGQH